ncbi:hypothetical protein ACHAXR_004887, partial [Thalassiosira sp. AJA248-18]
TPTRPDKTIKTHDYLALGSSPTGYSPSKKKNKHDNDGVTDDTAPLDSDFNTDGMVVLESPPHRKKMPREEQQPLGCIDLTTPDELKSKMHHENLDCSRGDLSGFTPIPVKYEGNADSINGEDFHELFDDLPTNLFPGHPGNATNSMANFMDYSGNRHNRGRGSIPGAGVSTHPRSGSHVRHHAGHPGHTHPGSNLGHPGHTHPPGSNLGPQNHGSHTRHNTRHAGHTLTGSHVPHPHPNLGPGNGSVHQTHLPTMPPNLGPGNGSVHQTHLPTMPEDRSIFHRGLGRHGQHQATTAPTTKHAARCYTGAQHQSTSMASTEQQTPYHNSPAINDSQMGVTMQLEGSPQAQAGGFYQSLSPGVLKAFPGHFEIIPECCIETSDSTIRQGGSMTDVEKRLLYGRAGFLKKQCPIYATHSTVSGPTGTSNGSIECMQIFKCRGSICGCNFQIKVCRVHDNGRWGVVAYQKCDKNGTRIPHTNHEKFPYYDSVTTGEKTKKINKKKIPRTSKRIQCPQSPSLQQQEFVANNYVKQSTRWNVFLDEMFDSPSVASHPEQRTPQGRKKLIEILKNWVRNNKQFIVGDKSTNEAMSINEVRAILDRLKKENAQTNRNGPYASPQKQGNTGERRLESLESFFDSAEWKALYNRLTVVDHNFGSRTDGKFHILCSRADALELVKEAATMYYVSRA